MPCVWLLGRFVVRVCECDFCHEEKKKSHRMKLLWMRLCGLYFCTIICVRLNDYARVSGHASDACLFFYSQILDCIVHVDVVFSDSVSRGGPRLFWLSRGFGIGHGVALVVPFYLYVVCI